MENITWKWLVISWILGLLISSAESQQPSGPLSFEKEKIRINIQDNEYQLIGDYYFKNNSSQQVRTMIYYPIVKRNNLPFPHYFKVTDLIRNENVQFHADSGGIRFMVAISAYSIRTYRVEYHQKTPEKKLEYILTTTALWGKPLKFSDFEITLPKKFILDSISLPVREKKISGDKTIYVIHEENFLPRKNLIIRWRQSHVKKIY